MHIFGRANHHSAAPETRRQNAPFRWQTLSARSLRKRGTNQTSIYLIVVATSLHCAGTIGVLSPTCLGSVEKA